MTDWYVKDQVVVITGGSKGIGLATAKKLVERGARVAILARSKPALDEAVTALGSDRVLGLAVDVCDKTAVTAAFDQVAGKWGRIDGLVNNVGFQFARRVEIMPEAEVRKMVDLNFFNVVFCCQAIIPYLRAAGGGRIVNVSSATVRNDNEFSHLALYSSCKAAVEHFSREIRHELKKDGIMVTVFSPGAVATGSIANFDPAAIAEAMQDWLGKGPKCDGMSQPEDIGTAIAACFELPPGIAVEMMEVRPNIPTPKMLESEMQPAG